MTEMKGNFYSNFTSNLGFAILAFFDKKLVDKKQNTILIQTKKHKNGLMFIKAGAVCCQLEGDNRLYVRIIGTLSRCRR